jgi:phosphate:Na+ symporter
MFLPFTGIVARFLEKAVVEEKMADTMEPRYLDEGVLSTPSLAISQAAREVLRMADIVQEMLVGTIKAVQEDDEGFVEKLEDMDDRVDKLDRGIRFYLAKLTGLSEDLSRREINLISITSDLENIGDIIDKNIMALARKRIKNRLNFSKDGVIEIREFHHKIMENFSLAVAAFTANDLDLAERVMKNKDRILELEKEYRNAHLERLRQGLRESFETSAIHLDLLSNIERINTHITHIAYTLIEKPGPPLEP